jgi:hypothetical protein
MLPPFDTTDPNLITALVHAREWLAMLAERDLIAELGATLSCECKWWEVQSFHHDGALSTWRETQGELPEEGSYLFVEVKLRPDLNLMELIAVLYLLRHLSFFTVQEFDHFCGQLRRTQERQLNVSYSHGQGFDSVLEWPPGF